MILVYFFIILICLLVPIFVIIFFLAQIVAHFTTQAPFVPIPDKIILDIVRSLHLNNASILYDLGCGDGRVLKEAVKSNPNIRAVGIEKALIPYLLARWNIRKSKNVEIRQEDIFTTDISDSTVIFFYLFPGVPDKLITAFEKRCKPGVRVVSCDFDCKDRKPTEVIDLDNLNSKRGKKLFVYAI